MLHDIWMAATRAEADKAFDLFVDAFGAKYAAAVSRLRNDRVELPAFYDFPAEHWIHLRATNPIESTFATVRLRTEKTKGSGSRLACLTMVFQAGDAGAEEMARAQRRHLAPGRHHRGSEVRGWDQEGTRLLNLRPHTQLLTIPQRSPLTSALSIPQPMDASHLPEAKAVLDRVTSLRLPLRGSRAVPKAP